MTCHIPGEHRGVPDASPQALLRPPPWTTDAACQGMAGGTADPWDEESPLAPVGRRICSSCPVRHPCALYALHEGIGHGLWGGLDPTDRRRIARRHGYPNPGAALHGEYAKYVTCTLDDGRPCADCREAKRRYMANRRAQGLEGRRDRPVIVLEHPEGRGRRRAYPGQYVLFVLPGPVRPAPTADTAGHKVAA